MKPPKSILDRSFVYVPAAATDVRKTFERNKPQVKEVEKKHEKIFRLKRIA